MSQELCSGLNAPAAAVCPKNDLTCPGRLSGFRPASRRRIDRADAFSPSVAFGVAHGDKPQSFPLLRRTDAASRQIGGPEGIGCGFQVSTNSGEPFKSIASRNLLSKDDCRAARADEIEPNGPEVATVRRSAALSETAERLTGATSGPNRSGVGPSGNLQRPRPSADAGEEMALGESVKVAGAHVNDASLVNVAARDCAGGDEVAEPLSGIRIVLIVVGTQHLASLGVNRISMNRLMRESGRATAEVGKECCYAPWTCCDPALLNEAAKEIERLRAIEEVARDLTALWQVQKVSGLPRAERNAAIEESRERLIRALAEIEYHSTDKNAAATARAALALDDERQPR